MSKSVLPIIGKVAPQALDAEEAVLGAVLQHKDAIEIVSHILKPEDFYKEANKIIYEACIILHEAFSPIDIVTVCQQLRSLGKLEIIGGRSYLSSLTGRVSSTANTEYHSFIVLQQSMRRVSIKLAYEAHEDSFDESKDILKTVEGLSEKADILNRHTLTVGRRVGINEELDPYSDVITFKGKSFLSIGNVSAIVAPPGSGKSNVMDAIAAVAINPNCDGLGFKVNTYGKKVFHADTERSKNDARKGAKRTAARVDITRYPELVEDGNFLKGYYFEMFKEVPDTIIRRKKVHRAIMSGEYKVILLDGLTDFMEDPNDLKEAQKVLSWLGAMASKYEVAILVTIHDNPKTNGAKGAPRGHIGSELHRKVEGLLLISNSKDDKNIKRITNDFDFGKLRNDGGVTENYFTWSDDIHMFCSTDYKESKENPKTTQKIKNIIDKVLAGGVSYNKVDLSKKIMEESGKSRPTSYGWIDKAIEYGWITENEYGKYGNGSTPF
jgi:hypothetical protein